MPWTSDDFDRITGRPPEAAPPPPVTSPPAAISNAPATPPAASPAATQAAAYDPSVPAYVRDQQSLVASPEFRAAHPFLAAGEDVGRNLAIGVTQAPVGVAEDLATLGRGAYHLGRAAITGGDMDWENKDLPNWLDAGTVGRALTPGDLVPTTGVERAYAGAGRGIGEGAPLLAVNPAVGIRAMIGGGAGGLTSTLGWQGDPTASGIGLHSAAGAVGGAAAAAGPEAAKASIGVLLGKIGMYHAAVGILGKTLPGFLTNAALGAGMGIQAGATTEDLAPGYKPGYWPNNPLPTGAPAAAPTPMPGPITPAAAAPLVPPQRPGAPLSALAGVNPLAPQGVQPQFSGWTTPTAANPTSTPILPDTRRPGQWVGGLLQ